MSSNIDYVRAETEYRAERIRRTFPTRWRRRSRHQSERGDR
jgi:hypothetical protein